MFAAAVRLAAITSVVLAGPTPAKFTQPRHDDPLVSRTPAVTIAGGTAEQQQTVRDAVARFVSVGLPLPELQVRIHAGNPGCEGMQGVFHRQGNVGVIDLCYGGEFLALHELGHAWERFNLDDHARARFQALTGATTWRSTDVAWGRRGAEQAANTIANGLLSTPLPSLQYHTDDLDRFEALTGIESPRIAEVMPATDTAPAIHETDQARLAAYQAWRHVGTAG